MREYEIEKQNYEQDAYVRCYGDFQDFVGA